MTNIFSDGFLQFSGYVGIFIILARRKKTITRKYDNLKEKVKDSRSKLFLCIRSGREFLVLAKIYGVRRFFIASFAISSCDRKRESFVFPSNCLLNTSFTENEKLGV